MSRRRSRRYACTDRFAWPPESSRFGTISGNGSRRDQPRGIRTPAGHSTRGAALHGPHHPRELTGQTACQKERFGILREAFSQGAALCLLIRQTMLRLGIASSCNGKRRDSRVRVIYFVQNASWASGSLVKNTCDQRWFLTAQQQDLCIAHFNKCDGGVIFIGHATILVTD